MAKEQVPYTPEQLRAVVYRERPYIFNSLRQTLSELLSIARTFAPLQKYEVTQSALSSVSNLLLGYLRLRDGDLLMPSSTTALLAPTDLQFDTVLTEALEGISSLYKAAIRSADVQLSQQVIEALEHLAVGSVSLRSLFSRPDENPTTALIRTYMFVPIQEGAIRGLDDVTMSGARAQANIAKNLLANNQFLTAQNAITDIAKLAHYSIAQRKSHVTGTPVGSLAEILQLTLDKPVVHGSAIRLVLDALQEICVSELQYQSSPLDESLRFSLGPFLDLAQSTALANLDGLVIGHLARSLSERNDSKADVYRSAIRQLHEQMWNRFVVIGRAAAKTKSFALFYVNSNIGAIVRNGLWLLAQLRNFREPANDQGPARAEWLNEHFEEDFLNELNWIVGATYWRIFEAIEPPLSRSLVWDFFSTLSHIGIQAVDAEIPILAQSAINELKSISLKCIDKPLQGLRTAAKIATYIARIGLVAEKSRRDEVFASSVLALREFQAKYIAKQIETNPDQEAYEATLLNELDELKDEMRRDRLLIDEEDAAFFSRILPSDIDSLIAKLEGRN